MSPETNDPADPSAWLKRAHSNLTRAKLFADSAGVLYEDCCFDAQQAAEKAIKALLVRIGIPFPKTHDILDLLNLLVSASIQVPEEILEADDLTAYAVHTRYPGLTEEVDKDEYLRAVALADRVVCWVETQIPSSPTPTQPRADEQT